MSLHECPSCTCGEDAEKTVQTGRLDRWFGKALLSRVENSIGGSESTYWEITRSNEILRQSHYRASMAFSGTIKNDKKMVKLAEKLGG